MYVNMKGIGREPIYATTAFKGNRFLNKDTSKFGKQELVIDEDKEANAFEKQKNKIEKYTGNVINDSDEEVSSSSRSHDQATHRQLIDQQQDLQLIEVGDNYDYESNKSGMIDDGTMNVFGFNDDLELDDRIIVKNATDNQIYQVVERPKYLLQFEQKDLEQDFLFQISKAESTKTTIFLALLIILNKVIILSDILQDDGPFQYTAQFYCMFPILAFELLLIYKLNNPTLQYVHVWTYLLLIYGIVVLLVLLTFQVKYLGKWTRAGFNELQI